MDGYKIFKIYAKDDYVLDNHTWTKDMYYGFIERENSVSLTSNEGEVRYVKERKEDLLKLFEVESV